MAGEKLIATNSKAKANYFIEAVVEAGLSLTGTEVKSLRTQSPNIKESYVDIKTNSKGDFEAYWLHANIPQYANGNIWNHEPSRDRKLLLHRRELDRLYGQIKQKGKTIVPLRLYFKKGRIKIELGIGKGKKKHDKRDTIKKRTADREMKRALKRTRA